MRGATYYLLKAAICCFAIRYQMSFWALILPAYLSIAASAGDWGQRDPGVRPAHCCPPQRWQRPCAVPAECQQQRGESRGACGRHSQQYEKVSVKYNLANLPQPSCHSQQHEKVSVTVSSLESNNWQICHNTTVIANNMKKSVSQSLIWRYHLADLPQHNCLSQQHEKVSVTVSSLESSNWQICHNCHSHKHEKVSVTVSNLKVSFGKFATTQLSQRTTRKHNFARVCERLSVASWVAFIYEDLPAACHWVQVCEVP